MARHNQEVPFWEVLDFIDRGIPASRKGIGFIEDDFREIDTQKYAEVMKMTTLVWYDLHPGENYLKRMQLEQWYKTILTTDHRQVLGAFKTISEILIESVRFSFPEMSGQKAYNTFKQYMNALHPYCGTVMFPMRAVIERWLNEGSPVDFAILRQAFCFPLRVDFSSRKVLEEQARTRYLENEERLQSLTLPDTDLSDIIQGWFPITMYEVFDWWQPSHGSGTVADHPGKNLVEKYHSLRCDEKLSFLSKRLPRTMLDDYLPNYRQMWPALDRTAEVLFVPKSWDKLRTICRECTTLQWYQQGFRRSICDIIDTYTYDEVERTSPYRVRKRYHPLHYRIRLRYSEQNMRLACDGSIDGCLDTIDLSDASDSVSFALVKSAFRKSILLSVAYCCRSSSARCPGMEVPLQQQKFAAMGSALCFPFMCILFAAMCEKAIERVDGKNAIRSSRYSVYGDDIVIEHKYSDTLVQLLVDFGFKVNKTKSCTTQLSNAVSLFRESCGGEYLDGYDATPVRISRRFGILSKNIAYVRQSKDIAISDARALVALVDLANQCKGKLRTLRQYVISLLTLLPPHLRPCFSLEGNIGIESDQPTNFQLGVPRYHVDFQRWVWRCGHNACKSKVVKNCEEIRLLESLRAASQRRPDDDILSSRAFEIAVDDTVAWVCRAEYSLFGSEGPDADPTTMLTDW